MSRRLSAVGATRQSVPSRTTALSVPSAPRCPPLLFLLVPYTEPVLVAWLHFVLNSLVPSRTGAPVRLLARSCGRGRSCTLLIACFSTHPLSSSHLLHHFSRPLPASASLKDAASSESSTFWLFHITQSGLFTFPAATTPGPYLAGPIKRASSSTEATASPTPQPFAPRKLHPVVSSTLRSEYTRLDVIAALTSCDYPSCSLPIRPPASASFSSRSFT